MDTTTMSPSEASASRAGEAPDSAIKTFRGRSLEEILPRVREELGPDAVVVRRREGLGGGLGGFFQRPFVEVDARGPLPSEAPSLLRNDRATTEGLASPAIQTLIDQASPFADALARAEVSVSSRAHDVMLAAARGGALATPAPAVKRAAAPARRTGGRAPGSPSVPAGLYGPQPNHVFEPAEPFAPDPFRYADHADDDDGAAAADAATAPAARDVLPPAPAPAPARPARPAFAADDLLPAAPAVDDEPLVATRVTEAPQAAVPAALSHARAVTALEDKLVAGGLGAAFAGDVVGEAVAHGLPFSQPRQLKTLARRALSRRLRPLSGLGSGPRRVAFVGAAGSGKSTAVAHLAAAYAATDVEVAVVALRSADGGRALASRLEPLGVTVVAADSPAQAARRLGGRTRALTLVDAPSTGPMDKAEVAKLTRDLRALDVSEVHLTLPATISAASAGELADLLAPAGLTHVVLAHADQTTRPGAVVELAVTRDHALSYVCTREELAPADPEGVVRQLLP